MTLKQACSSEYQGAQDAFKDSMIHWILQFTLLIAFRCVLHRCESQEIRCWKLYIKLFMGTERPRSTFYYIHKVYVSDIEPRDTRQSWLWKTQQSSTYPSGQIIASLGSTNSAQCGKNKDDKRALAPLKSQQQPIMVYSIMILPQVHLRKPCYDFYFL